jgi:hypothetical protein
MLKQRIIVLTNRFRSILNSPRPGCDREQPSSRAANLSRGQIFVTSIRPDNSDPIPLRPSPPGIGTLVIRFVGLLVVAVVVSRWPGAADIQRGSALIR